MIRREQQHVLARAPGMGATDGPSKRPAFFLFFLSRAGIPEERS